ncbi:DUF1223 domain-containing protein [Tardiphaga sp. 862_B3_N1_1]|uniref:DUF1223 domain-containing protein n=1 Tax=Tardiphaga sp. 862_B3_N1_1 TaxID=3240763 RepID=UPI003F89F5ED
MSLSLSALSALALTVLPAMATAAERPIVVELFTSQGCSSCPPANAFLNDMARERPDVLPLAFHVTYWDRLGWKDPFSLEAATARQAKYGHRFGDGSYTPEMVIDGSVGLVGSHVQEVNAAIDRAKRERKPVAEVNLSRVGGNILIKVGPGNGSGRLLLVGFDHEHTTKIGRGENGGRSLTEVNVVRSVRPIADWSGEALQLNERFPDGEDAAVIIERVDGHIVGAARLARGSS